jgi:hypothetical protein
VTRPRPRLPDHDDEPVAEIDHDIVAHVRAVLARLAHLESLPQSSYRTPPEWFVNERRALEWILSVIRQTHPAEYSVGRLIPKE